MPGEISYLILTAITISCLHTVTGPDHYVPFIALSKSKKWSVNRTIFFTLICGMGHVSSSVILGLAGIAFGWSIAKITWLENVRGGISGWAMLLLGFAYTIYAFVQLKRNKLHKHFDVYEDGNMYVYEHEHGGTVLPQQKRQVTPWLCLLFLFLALASHLFRCFRFLLHSIQFMA